MRAAQLEGGGGHKSYILPAVEIVAMDALVNLGGRALMEPADYEVTASSIRRNLRGRWVVDDDPNGRRQISASVPGLMRVISCETCIRITLGSRTNFLSASRSRIEKYAFDRYPRKTHVGIPPAAGGARKAMRSNSIGFMCRWLASHD